MMSQEVIEANEQHKNKFLVSALSEKQSIAQERLIGLDLKSLRDDWRVIFVPGAHLFEIEENFYQDGGAAFQVSYFVPGYDLLKSARKIARGLFSCVDSDDDTTGLVEKSVMESLRKLSENFPQILTEEVIVEMTAGVAL